VIPAGERVLLRLTWTDATNVAGGWFDAADLGAWAADGAWECTNTGWLVYEDDLCYVLAGRMTTDGRNVGLIERIPKAAVTTVTTVQAGFPAAADLLPAGHPARP
jgi:uncharacterized cupin superfamily protein